MKRESDSIEQYRYFNPRGPGSNEDLSKMDPKHIFWELWVRLSEIEDWLRKNANNPTLQKEVADMKEMLEDTKKTFNEFPISVRFTFNEFRDWLEAYPPGTPCVKKLIENMKSYTRGKEEYVMQTTGFNLNPN
jgi:hypothetical protein